MKTGYANQRVDLPRFALLVTWALLGGMAALVLWPLLPVVLSRLSFPMGVEHQEEIHTGIVYWWIRGKALYAEPSLEVSSWIYTPGYYFAARLWSAIFGLSIPSLRALSWVSVFLTAIVVNEISKTHRDQHGFGWGWLPLYLAFFGFYGWIDLAMKDSFHILLVFTAYLLLFRALFSLKDRRAKIAAYLSGVVWALAAMTKQTTVLNLVALVPCVFLVDRRNGVRLCVAFGVAMLVMVLASVLAWGTFFLEWTYFIPQKHEYRLHVAFDHLSFFASRAFPLFLIVAVALLRSDQRRSEGAPDSPSPFGFGPKEIVLGGFLLGCALASFIPAGKDGGGIYNYPIFAAALSFAAIISLSYLVNNRAFLLVLLLPLTIVDFRHRAVPAQSYAGLEHLKKIIQAVNGPVWVPYHPWLPKLAGKEPMASWESAFGQWGAGGGRMPPSWEPAITGRLFDLIILDKEDDLLHNPLGKPITTHYRFIEKIPENLLVKPRDGWLDRNPSLILQRNSR